MKDFPAAHSMDTTWFAVDADGNVGRFRSGEDGAVPLEAPSEEIDFLLYATLAARLFAERDFGPPAVIDDYARSVVFSVRSDAVAGYRATASSAAESLVPAKDLIILREAGPRVCATTKPIKASIIRELAKHPDVRSLAVDSWMFDLADEEDIGIFDYTHDDDPGRAYVRAVDPAKPIKLDELPAPVQEDLSGLKLPLRFKEAPRLHLADHMTDEQAACWGEVTLRGEPKPQPPRATDRERSKLAGVAIAVIVVLALAWLLLRR
jgi:hypothetical protein